ncbi:MAG: hypothetical protein IIB12_05710 [Chloroflexi bacterium]|nr:hypothetical protein [Chloroflexota bacterium]
MKKRLMAVFGAALILTVVSVTGVALAGNGPEAAPGGGPKPAASHPRRKGLLDRTTASILTNATSFTTSTLATRMASQTPASRRASRGSPSASRIPRLE